MATRDYVNRQPKPRKPKKNQQQQRKVSIIRITMTFLVLFGFIAGLYWLSQQPLGQGIADEPNETSVPKQSLAESSVQSINDEPLPELPQEEWEFIKILPGYEVEVDVEAITSDKLFLMQCGSFRQFEQADSMKATMALAGLEPQIRGSNNGWYRVILGPYDSRRDAEKDRHKLQGVNIHSCKIWLWNL
jgi:cell division protein FtsN